MRRSVTAQIAPPLSTPAGRGGYSAGTQVSRDNARLAAELTDLHSQEQRAQQQLKATGRSQETVKTKNTHLETVHEMHTEAAAASAEAHQKLQAEYSELRSRYEQEKDAVRRLTQTKLHDELMAKIDAWAGWQLAEPLDHGLGILSSCPTTSWFSSAIPSVLARSISIHLYPSP